MQTLQQPRWGDPSLCLDSSSCHSDAVIKKNCLKVFRNNVCMLETVKHVIVVITSSVASTDARC